MQYVYKTKKHQNKEHETGYLRRKKFVVTRVPKEKFHSEWVYKMVHILRNPKIGECGLSNYVRRVVEVSWCGYKIQRNDLME